MSTKSMTAETIATETMSTATSTTPDSQESATSTNTNPVVTKLNSRNEIHDLLMEWGAYRSGYSPLGLGYGQSILGKMIAGLKGTTCNKCIGRRKVFDVVSDSWTDCPLCKGKGRINVATPGKINPALIRATGSSGGYVEEPEFCQRIDKALLRLKIKHRIAIVGRYVDLPRWSDGDRRLKVANKWLVKIGEKPVSKRRLENLLSEARGEIGGCCDRVSSPKPD